MQSERAYRECKKIWERGGWNSPGWEAALFAASPLEELAATRLDMGRLVRGTDGDETILNNKEMTLYPGQRLDVI